MFDNFSYYSNDTEVMTNSGWKLIKNIDINKDLIMSLNPKNKEIEMVKATNLISTFIDGELYHFKTQKMDFCVTKNHKMVYIKKNERKINFKKAENIFFNVDRIPSQGFSWRGKKQEYFILPSVKQKQQYSNKDIIIPKKKIKMEDWLEFFGFWLADGCYRDHINTYGKRDYSISIKQDVKNEKYVLNLIEKIGFNCSISAGSDKNNKNYNIYSKQLWTYLSQFGRSADKFVPREFLELDIYYLIFLLKGYMNGDSYIDKNSSSHHFSSISFKLIENIQELILKVFGRISNFRISYYKLKKSENIIPLYEINIKLNESKILNTLYRYKEKISYNDNAFCLTLEKNHIMLIRSNKKINWCCDFNENKE